MSTTYQIISLVTLKTSTVSLDKLSRSLNLNSIICCDDQPLGLVTHWDLVFSARTWAGWALEECGEKPPPPSALEALSLVDKWLQDSGSVSSEELRAAGAAAEAAARAAAGAAAAAAAEAAAYQRQGEFITEHLKNSSQTSFPFPRT